MNEARRCARSRFDPHAAAATLSAIAILFRAPAANADGADETAPRAAAKPTGMDKPAVAPAAGGADQTGPSLLPKTRYELAGFPILGGNTDIGFQFGAAATLTRFYNDVFPYEWNVDLLLSASAKSDQGLRLVQQSHVLRLDAPDLLHGRARLDTRLSFQRTINAGYFGIGNATPATPTSDPCAQGRRFQYLQEEGRVRGIARIHTPVQGLDVAVGFNFRGENPSVYCGSKLAADLAQTPQAGAPPVVGGEPTFLGGGSAGAMLDTRDSEFITTRGIYYQLGISGTGGTAEHVGYGEAAAVLAHYAPLGGPFIFAGRVVASFQFGRVPFYDLQQGGVFEPQYLFGSENGVRGVPFGRYAGQIKVLSNLEFRSTPFPKFNLLGQLFRIGTTTFFDVGRVWSGYSTISAADGTSIGLKFGVGGGLFLQWGEAAIFRVEAAYSPDAVAENPSLPIGIYVSDGLMF
ncbi:MAG TPA: BamA/TamA family outer membrane protein [Polyangiaceae bacterium]|nr:BamA/TamA family outer membrane protein [Polyangiaceae bacterium]